MLDDSKPFSSFSIDDVAKAKKFYGDVLGLTVKEQGSMGLELNLNGGMRVFLYPKPNHEPATFTVLNFVVDDLEKTVDDLAAKGVTFEHYDEDMLKTDKKGIAHSGSPEQSPDIAWFKDPAGNTLAVLHSNVSE